MPKRIAASPDSQPPFSRYALKHLKALEKGLIQSPSPDELSPIPIIEKGVTATITSFSHRQTYIFPVTATGEKIYLKMEMVAKADLRIRPGDTIVCDVCDAEPGKCRFVIWISRVYRVYRQRR